ncbi:MAG: hypothetical protein ACTIAG_02240 [Lactobacillus sp.]
METCPNCGQKIADETVCPQCGFDLAKYRETFFARNHKPETDQAGNSRYDYRAQTPPADRPNGTVQKMMAWIRQNATIVYLLGILLLVVMSFSRLAGWVGFLGLMIWLYIICERSEKIAQYTADQRLSQQLSQLGTRALNKIDSGRERVATSSAQFESKYPKMGKHLTKLKLPRRHANYRSLLVIFLAFSTFVVMFAGAGASVEQVTYNERMSISNALLTIGGKLLASSSTFGYGVIFYLFWLFLVLVPLIVIVQSFKGRRRNRAVALIASLLETGVLFYLVFNLAKAPVGTGLVPTLTSELNAYATAIGTSTYFLILASVLTTVASAYVLLRRDRHAKPEKKTDDEQ